MSRPLPIAGVLSVLLAACLPPSATTTGATVLQDQLGHIERLAASEPALYLLYPDAEPDLRYCLDASELSDDFKRPGTRVRFSGVVGEPAANARMACQPFELRSIQALPPAA